MKLKEGVLIHEMTPQILLAIMIADRVFSEAGSPLVLTSVCDGTHKVGSLHYSGDAVDLRIWHLDDPQATAQVLRESLGENYDVVLERTHIHVEYDPD